MILVFGDFEKFWCLEVFILIFCEGFGKFFFFVEGDVFCVLFLCGGGVVEWFIDDEMIIYDDYFVVSYCWGVVDLYGDFCGE